MDPANVRALDVEAADALGQAEKEAEATKMALKRKVEQAATSDYQIRSLPTKLKIDPNDPEDVVSELVFCSIYLQLQVNLNTSMCHHSSYYFCV